MYQDLDKRSFVNYLRGIAIFLMLWGHCIQYCCGDQFDFFENLAFKFIYSFNMPLFMLISGYLFFFSAQKRSFVELVEHKAKGLLYPIFTCSIVNYALTIGVKSLIYRDYPSALQFTGLWFLWSVLACSIALSFVCKASSNYIIKALLLFVMILFIAIVPNGQMNIWMYPYFILGFVVAKKEKLVFKFKIYIGIISSIIFAVMFLMFEKKHYIYTSGLLGGNTLVESLFIDLFRWTIGLFASIAIIWICLIIYRYIKFWEITKAVQKLGVDSLAIYALSVSFLSYWLPKLFAVILNSLPWIDWNKYIWIFNFMITPFVAVVYAVFLLFLVKILKKFNAYSLLFGR